MKTLKHKLMSNPDKEIELSEEHVGIADNLIRDLKGLINRGAVNDVLQKYCYRWDEQINLQAHNLFDASKESAEYKIANDKLHILIGIQAVEENTKVGLSDIKEEYEKKKEEFLKKNYSMHDNLAWHFGHLK